MRRVPFPLKLLFLLLGGSLALIPEDGICDLFVYVPFTYNGTDQAFDINGTANSWGYTHMAAAMIAVEHFNNRDSTIFTQLANFTYSCPIKLRPRFLDSQVVGHHAAETFTQQEMIPCAIAGPFSDQPALELSTLATAYQFPLVAYRAYNNRISEQAVNPFSSQVFPDLEASSEALLSFLFYTNRTNYINFIYPANDAGSQRREALTRLLDENEMQWFAEPYEVPLDYNGKQLYLTMRSLLEKVKEKGYRTIVVSLDDPVYEQIVPLSIAAEELGMLGNDYFWIWLGSIDVFEDPSNLSVDSLDRLLQGSAWIAAGEEYFALPFQDPFYNTWVQQDEAFVERLEQVNPIEAGEPGYVPASADYFQNIFPDWGSGLMADAVMSIGIGACMAAERATKSDYNSSSSTPRIVTGQEHLRGIRDVSFRGASSNMVRFSPNSKGRPGTRDPTTVLWAAFNFQNTSLLEDQFSHQYYDTDASTDITMNIVGTRAGEGEWEMFQPFQFADGTLNPPDLLRDLPEQNYLSPALQIFGLILMSSAILLGIVAIVWVYVHRNHTVLLAAQPQFLYLIAIGSILFAFSIFFISFDESFGVSEEHLDRLCMSQPWFYGVGYVVIYGALYGKLWRVNAALQFTRRRVGFFRAVLPSLIVFLLVVTSLSLSTALDPSEWVREVTDEETGESVGRCRSGSDGVVTLMMIVVTIMAACYAWRTRDVDSAYSESWWILMLILLQFEIAVVAVPVIVILEDVNTNGYYFGNVILAWIFPMSALLFIMLPKVAAHYAAVHDTHTRIRGSGGHGQTRISGVPSGMPASSNTGGSSGTQVVELTSTALQDVMASAKASPPS